MDVSVIIPSYNRASVLPRAIASVQAQSLPAREILIVDDGSDDQTKALVHHQFPGCRYFFQTNQGVSQARNLGIRKARYEWLAFLDSDDEWLPGKLEAQVAALSESPGQRLCHTEEIWIRHGRRVNAMKKHAKSGGDIFLKCLPLCVISPSAVMIHRSVFDEVGLFDESLPACEDYDLWLRICARETVAFVPEPQIKKYGGHDDQLSRKYWGMDRFRVRALEKIITSQALSVEQQKAALETVIGQYAVLANGALKRDMLDRASSYARKKQHFNMMLSSLVAENVLEGKCPDD